MLSLLLLLDGYGQTKLELLRQYAHHLEWQTPRAEVDSILNEVFEGGNKQFVEVICGNIKWASDHQDYWVRNYLVEIEASAEGLKIEFGNRPIETDQVSITQALSKTKPYWKNENPVRIRLLFSTDCAKQFNPAVSEAYLSLNQYRMVSPADCVQTDACLFEDRETLLAKISELKEMNELEGQIYYLKILVRRFPFDQQLNAQLRALLVEN